MIWSTYNSQDLMNVIEMMEEITSLRIQATRTTANKVRKTRDVFLNEIDEKKKTTNVFDRCVIRIEKKRENIEILLFCLSLTND